MEAIIKSVPINSGLNHWIGKKAKVINSINTPKGTLITLEDRGLIVELLEFRIEYLSNN
jgi:hypothetical protein